jgi:hypothetical protein
LSFFGDKMLCDINGDLCRTYVLRRSTDAAARRELEDLRAAINHHRSEGLCSQVVAIVLPDERPPRDRWLTRREAAALVRAAWRYREIQKGAKTDRRSRRHVAKFILVGLYTGTRSGAICGAALEPTIGRGWIDVDRGVFYRRPAGKRETNKRQPPAPLPGQLLAHLRRWKRRGQRFAVEWNGKSVKSIEKAFSHVVGDAGLGSDVTPHVLRHTAATWMMQSGTSPWEAAGWVKSESSGSVQSRNAAFAQIRFGDRARNRLRHRKQTARRFRGPGRCRWLPRVAIRRRFGPWQAEEGARLVEDVTQTVEPPVHGDEIEEIAMFASSGVGLMCSCT